MATSNMHGLVQATARVNGVFKDKPGGLVVDYLGLAQELREALAVYTVTGQIKTSQLRALQNRPV